MSNGNSDVRRDLHEHIFGIHEALDKLEADDELATMDYLLMAAGGMFVSGKERFDQLQYCLDTYGRTTGPPPIPLYDGEVRDRESGEVRS